MSTHAEHNGGTEPQTVPINMTAATAVTVVTGPQTVPGGELLPATEHLLIADALMQAMPGFDIDACGYCRAVFTGADPDVLRWTRPLERLRYLAYEAGWAYDADRTWTCPDCQESDGWKARHRALEVSPRFCERHDVADGGRARCTCPGVILAVDVMLASHDYPDILRASDRRIAAIMTADGRYAWNYEEWRERWARPEAGQHRGAPVAEQSAAA